MPDAGASARKPQVLPGGELGQVVSDTETGWGPRFRQHRLAAVSAGGPLPRRLKPVPTFWAKPGAGFRVTGPSLASPVNTALSRAMLGNT